MPTEDNNTPASDDNEPANGPDIPKPDNPGRRVDSFMLISLAIGLVLMGGSKMLGFYTQAESQLILVMGLGIVLGALGSAAVIQYKAWVVTGGAAIGLLLGWFLTQTSTGNYAIIQLKKLPEEATATMFDADEFYRAQTTRAHEFIVLPGHVKAKSFQAEIAVGEDNSMIFGCIPSGLVRSAMGTGEPISWNYHVEGENGAVVLVDDETRVVARIGPCVTAALQPTDGQASLLRWVSLAAFAADKLPSKMLIKGLRSKSSYSRRQARAALAKKGAEAVPDLLDALQHSGGNYRTELGVMIALSDMLTSQPELRGQITTSLTNEHLNAIARLAGHRDDTMRSYALKSLDLIEDSRVPAAISVALADAAPEAEADLLEVLKGKLVHGAKPQESVLHRAVTSVRTKSGANPDSSKSVLVDEIAHAADGKAEDIDKVYLQIGAFTDEGRAADYAAALNQKQDAARIAVTKRRRGESIVRVVAGGYQPRADAERLREKLLATGVVKDAILSNYPDVLQK